eukprot:CAMPEP_0185841122 /NCGR_PEP_ID=MMETSP1353-20130828/17374_1 /TAXON_ID=1077150 /ORGANISM="Erythrolobus australicus, Strain CCMP3124" /LENGTH=363 /DNA_ID=CAMNT_0028540529 /DNA_START=14 /DNA_END=1101 /DNA_ORIENTATION=-
MLLGESHFASVTSHHAIDVLKRRVDYIDSKIAALEPIAADIRLADTTLRRAMSLRRCRECHAFALQIRCDSVGDLSLSAHVRCSACTSTSFGSDHNEILNEKHSANWSEFVRALEDADVQSHFVNLVEEYENGASLPSKIHGVPLGGETQLDQDGGTDIDSASERTSAESDSGAMLAELCEMEGEARRLEASDIGQALKKLEEAESLAEEPHKAQHVPAHSSNLGDFGSGFSRGFLRNDKKGSKSVRFAHQDNADAPYLISANHADPSSTTAAINTRVARQNAPSDAGMSSVSSRAPVASENVDVLGRVIERHALGTNLQPKSPSKIPDAQRSSSEAASHRSLFAQQRAAARAAAAAAAAAAA